MGVDAEEYKEVYLTLGCLAGFHPFLLPLGEHWETLFSNQAPNCGPTDHKLANALPTDHVTMCVWEFRVVQILEKVWHPTPVLLPGKSHGRRSLVGRSPWGR